MAATDCSVNHGLPGPWCVTVRVSLAAILLQGRNMLLLRRLPGAAGAPNHVVWCAAPEASVVLMRSTLLQSTLAFPVLMAALVLPATVTASNFAENFSKASPPHRLAVVVYQAPCCWRPMKPLARRPMSSFHAG